MRAVLAAALLSVSPLPAAWAQEAGSEARRGLISVSGFLLFRNARGPLSYVSEAAPALGAETRPVFGRGCQHGLSIPITMAVRGPRIAAAAGRGGYEIALAKIREAHPGLKGLYDMKVDDHVISVLGIYHRVCTEINARGFS